MDLNLEGKIALVTGAGGGIGQAVARTLLDEGARVVGGDTADGWELPIGASPGLDAGNELRARLDVTSEDSWRDLVVRVRDGYGEVSVLVNCAGLNSEADAVD